MRDKYGVDPREMVDFMALMGDASDNIPGVKGIGRVMAGKLISQYHTLENVYANIDEISSESLKKKLLEGREMAQFSREMVCLDKALPIEPDIKRLCLGRMDTDRLIELYRELEFEKLLKEILPEKVNLGEYVLKSGARETKDVCEEIKTCGLTAFRVFEYAGQKKIKAVSFSLVQGKAYYVLLPKEESGYKESRELLKELLEDENVRKVCCNAKKEMFLLLSLIHI